MSDTFIETPAETDGSRLQIIAAVILGIAATLTAFSSYQASLQDGMVLDAYTKSNRAVSDSNGWYTQGNQTFAQDQQLFVEFASASQSEAGAGLAEYLKSDLMRPELAEAVDWWVEQPEPAEGEDPVTPFSTEAGSPYTVDEFDEGERFQTIAEKELAKGAEAGDKGDKFGLSTVLFALTLFFGGIATLFTRRTVRVGLLVTSVLVLAAGAAQFATAVVA